MKRGTGFWLSIALPMAVVPFLPLYVVRTMTRSFVTGSGGDIISYDLELRTLLAAFEGLRYARPEDSYGLVLALDVGLAFAYAAAVGFALRRLARRIGSRKD